MPRVATEMSSEIILRGVKIAGEVGSRAVGNERRVRWKEDEIKREEKKKEEEEEEEGRVGGGAARCKEVDRTEEAAAEETKVLLGGRTKGGWVLSRFALHAPELCAEVVPGKREADPLLREELPSVREELITSAISPSLDAAEDHDFRRDPS